MLVAASAVGRSCYCRHRCRRCRRLRCHRRRAVIIIHHSSFRIHHPHPHQPHHPHHSSASSSFIIHHPHPHPHPHAIKRAQVPADRPAMMTPAAVGRVLFCISIHYFLRTKPHTSLLNDRFISLLIFFFTVDISHFDTHLMKGHRRLAKIQF